MKLYVLKPSEEWSYCGGAIVAIAEDFEDLKKLCSENEETSGEKIFYSQYDIKSEDHYNMWVKVESFNVDGESRRVVFSDYNWA
jgi:hypothetical protein